MLGCRLVFAVLVSLAATAALVRPAEAVAKIGWQELEAFENRLKFSHAIDARTLKDLRAAATSNSPAPRVIMLAGGRGSGKTTAAKTLLESVMDLETANRRFGQEPKYLTMDCSDTWITFQDYVSKTVADRRRPLILFDDVGPCLAQFLSNTRNCRTNRDGMCDHGYLIITTNTGFCPPDQNLVTPADWNLCGPEPFSSIVTERLKDLQAKRRRETGIADVPLDELNKQAVLVLQGVLSSAMTGADVIPLVISMAGAFIDHSALVVDCDCDPGGSCETYAAQPPPSSADAHLSVTSSVLLRRLSAAVFRQELCPVVKLPRGTVIWDREMVFSHVVALKDKSLRFYNGKSLVNFILPFRSLAAAALARAAADQQSRSRWERMLGMDFVYVFVICQPTDRGPIPNLAEDIYYLREDLLSALREGVEEARDASLRNAESCYRVTAFHATDDELLWAAIVAWRAEPDFDRRRNPKSLFKDFGMELVRTASDAGLTMRKEWCCSCGIQAFIKWSSDDCPQGVCVTVAEQPCGFSSTVRCVTTSHHVYRHQFFQELQVFRGPYGEQLGAFEESLYAPPNTSSLLSMRPFSRDVELNLGTINAHHHPNETISREISLGIQQYEAEFNCICSRGTLPRSGQNKALLNSFKEHCPDAHHLAEVRRN